MKVQSQTVINIICTLLFLSVLTTNSLRAAGHVGRIGDAIDYKTGTLSFSETDVTVRGRNGLDINITRSYSTSAFESSKNSRETNFELGELLDSSLFRHLGRNWRIEYPSLKNVEDRANLVYSNGSMEDLFYVIDTLIIDTTVNPHDSTWTTTKNDSLFTRKTRGLSLLTGFGVGDATPDTMLLTNGARMIFGHLVDSVKYMTQQINKYGDTLTVEYHDSSLFIKRVVSPIGRDVKFVYGEDGVLLDYDSIPSSSHRLYQLQFKNYLDSTLTVNYRYSSNDEYLTEVIHPMGDTTKYEYSSTLVRNFWVDWASPKSDNFDYANDYDTTLGVKLLSKIIDPNGASAEFRYRSMLYPLYSQLSEYNSINSLGGDGIPSKLYDFYAYPAVYQRIADGDTLFIRYEMIFENLQDDGYEYLEGAKTTVNLPAGTEEHFYYNVDFYREFDQDLFLIAEIFHGGFQPGALKYKAYLSSDSNFTGYSYSSGKDKMVIGVYADTIVDTLIIPIYDAGGTYIEDSTLIDTVFYDPEIYSSYRSGIKYDVDYIDSYGGSSQWDTGKRRSTAAYSIVDVNAANFPIYSVTGQYDSALYTDKKDFYENPWGVSTQWGDNSTLADSAIYYSPALYPLDSLSFVKDSVMDYEYIPRLNKTILKKVRHTVQNGKFYYSYIEEFEHDTIYYQTTESRTYNEVDTTNVFISKFIYDDSTHNLIHTISPIGDTTTIIYDTLYNQLVIAELNSRITDTLYKNEYYGTSFKLKSTTNRNGATTYFYYDFYGRDSLVKSPLETEFSIKQIYQKDSSWNATIVKIDSGQELYTRSYYDKYYKPVKSMLRINDSVTVIDTAVYNSYGQVEKTARSVFNTYDSTNTIWTNYFYRIDMSLFKTILPTNDSSFSTKIDELTYKSTTQQGLRGAKSIAFTDYDGNLLKSLAIVDSFHIVFDSIITDSCYWIVDSLVCDTTITYTNDTIDTIYYADVDTLEVNFEYGKYNNLLKSIDAKGLEHSFEYDQYGRKIKIIDPDIGTIRVWYDRWGKIRFVKRNSEDSSYYYKYDDLFRIIEEGLVYNPDTLQVDSTSYPTTGNSKTVWYRYDDYVVVGDTVGGLSHSKGRLTEINYYSNGWEGYIGYYYDKRGRLGKLVQTNPGLVTQKIKYEYYANNALKKIIYPDSSFTEYTLNDAGQTIGVSDIIGIDSVSYESWGAIKDVLYQNGIKTKNSYDILGRNTKTINYSVVNSYEFNFFSRQYVFENGFIKEEYDLDTLGDTTSYGMVRSYGYDLFGRLDSAFIKDPNGAAPNRIANYSYDINNNLDSKYISGIDSLFYIRYDSLNCDSILRFGNDSIYAYTRNERGLITEITTYMDTIPGLTYPRKKTITYNQNNQVDTIITSSFPTPFGDGPDTLVNYYNAFGQKIRQQFLYQRAPEFGWIWLAVEENTYYVWSGGKLILEYRYQQSTPSINIYGLGKMLAKKSYNFNTWIYDYYITNKYGSVVSLVQPTGVPRDWRIEYYPYGDIYSINGMGASEKTFVGKEEDRSGELDFGPRYYSVTGGRFLAPDPILSGASPYSYAEGNPIMLYDPSGLISLGAIARNAYADRMIEQYDELNTREDVWEHERAKQESAEHQFRENQHRAISEANEREGQYTYEQGKGSLVTYRDSRGNTSDFYIGGAPYNKTTQTSTENGYVSINTSGDFVGEQGEYWDEEFGIEVRDEIFELNKTVTITAERSKLDEFSLPGRHEAAPIIGLVFEKLETYVTPFLVAHMELLVGGVLIGGGVVATIAGIVFVPATYGASLFLVPAGISMVAAGGLLSGYGINTYLNHFNMLLGTDIPTLHDWQPDVFPEWPSSSDH